MPTDYHCEACNLVVQIGWYHYHNSDDGYWAATLGFCQRCGTIHRMEHACNESGLADRLFAQLGPLGLGGSKMEGLTYSVPLQDWIALEQSRSCAHCGTSNEILFESSATIEICPQSDSPQMKKLLSWMT